LFNGNVAINIFLIGDLRWCREEGGVGGVIVWRRGYRKWEIERHLARTCNALVGFPLYCLFFGLHKKFTGL